MTSATPTGLAPAGVGSAVASHDAAASKSEVAYGWIRARIATGEYGTGFRLVLGAIADTLGMSVVPVREAIRRLEAEDLVTFEKNVGARVALVDESEYQHTMQTLGLVEGSAVALSLPLLTSGQIEQAAEVNDRMLAALDAFDAHDFSQLNRRFHAALYEPCPNPHILGLVHRGWSRLSGLLDSTFEFVPGRARHSVEEHAEILELIRTGADPLEVELAVRNHRWRTMEAFLQRDGASDFPTPPSSDP